MAGRKNKKHNQDNRVCRETRHPFCRQIKKLSAVHTYAAGSFFIYLKLSQRTFFVLNGNLTYKLHHGTIFFRIFAYFTNGNSGYKLLHNMMAQNITSDCQWNILPSSCIRFDAGRRGMDGIKTTFSTNILYIFRRYYLVVTNNLLSLSLSLSLSKQA